MTVLATATLLALVAACAAAIVSALALARRDLDRWANRGLWLATGLTALPLGLLVLAFLRADLTIFYVWENTHASYAWWLRLAGVWGGQAGTFLLWGFAVLAASAIEARRAKRSAWPLARTALLVTAALLLLAPVVLDLGAATSQFGLDVSSGTIERGGTVSSPLELRPQGEGLNPLLESVYMAIHPFIQFLAYGMAAIPFAYGLTYLATGEPYHQACTRWARAAWLAFLTAITLGSLWAYNVLSFGGYWVWDPVEVGNLLPFIALTIHLHAERERSEDHLGLLGPSSAVAGFVLVIFATFITRSGLWSSVHAFLPTGLSITVQDPLSRLQAAVDASFQARYSTGLLAAGLGAFSASACAFHARASTGRQATGWRAAAIVYGLVGLVGLIAPSTLVALAHRIGLLLSLGEPLGAPVALLVLALAPMLAALVLAPADTPTGTTTRQGQLVLAVAVLSLALVATTVLLLLGINGYDETVFEARAPLIAVPVLALIGLSIHPEPHTRRLAWILGGLVASGLAYLATRSWAVAAIPLCLASLLGPAWLFARRAHPGEGRRGVARGALLLGAGVLGFVQWASPGAVVLPTGTLSSPGWYVPIGLLASGLTLLAPMLEAHRRVPWWLGPLAGVAALGYGLGAVLALVAGGLGWRGLAGPRAPLSKAGVPLIHVGLVVLVLGVAGSTYASETWSYDQADPLVRGEPRQAGPYTVELVDGRLENHDDDPLIEEVVAVVHVSRGSTFVDEVELRLVYSVNAGLQRRGAYVPEESPVTRGWAGDLAHNADTQAPLAIGVRETNRTWVTANGPAPAELVGQIDAVSMGVKHLPAVNLVWGAVWVIGLGMVTRMGPAWPRRVDQTRDPTAK